MKRILKLLGLVLLLLICVLAFNTWRYQPPASTLESAALPEVDAQKLAEQVGHSIRFKTISVRQPGTYPPDFQGFVDWLVSEFPAANAAMEREMISGYTPLYKWVGQDTDAKPVLLTGHYDVVPVSIDSDRNWDHPPFSGKIADGFVYGRGTMDDKGAIVAMMSAVESLAAQGFKPARTVYFSFGHDEEIGGADGAGAVVKHLQDNNIQLAWSLDEGSALLRKIIPGLTRDVASINVTEKGYATLDISALAKGGHSSLPPNETAITALAEAITKLKDNPMPGGLQDATKDFFDGLGPHFEWPQRVLFANQWLFRPILESVLSGSASTNAMLRTTTAPTMLVASNKENVLPQRATATVNFRMHPRDSIDDLIAHVTKTIDNPDIEVTLRGGFASEAARVASAQNEAFGLLSKTSKQVFGDVVVVPGMTIAATDSRHYSKVADDSYRFNPFIMGNDDIPRLHGSNERLSIESLERGVQFYSLVLQGL